MIIHNLVKKVMLFTAILMSLSAPYAFAEADYSFAETLSTQSAVVIGGELTPTIEIQTEEEARALLDSMNSEEKKSLKASALGQLSKVKKKWLDQDYCVPAGRFTLAVAVGISITIILMPVAVALLILAIPISAIDLATGCKVIYDL